MTAGGFSGVIIILYYPMFVNKFVLFSFHSERVVVMVRLFEHHILTFIRRVVVLRSFSSSFIEIYFIVSSY